MQLRKRLLFANILVCIFTFKYSNAQKFLLGFEVEEGAYIYKLKDKYSGSNTTKYNYLNKRTYLKQNLSVQYFNKKNSAIGIGLGYNPTRGEDKYLPIDNTSPELVKFNGKNNITYLSLSYARLNTKNKFILSYGVQFRNEIVSKERQSHYTHSSINDSIYLAQIEKITFPGIIFSSLGLHFNLNYGVTQHIYLGTGLHIGPQFIYSKGTATNVVTSYPSGDIVSTTNLKVNRTNISLLYYPNIRLSYLIK